MAFSVIENPGRTLWMQGDGASTYYKGQIVICNTNASTETDGTVAPLAAASGAADLTQKQVICGIVTGFNQRTPRYTTVGSILTEYDGGAITSQASQLARDFTGVEGMWSKSDPTVYIQVTEVNALSVIRGPIYSGAYGTAPTVATVSASTDSDGMISANVTVNTPGYTHVTKTGTIYCRSGGNMGIYRTNKNTTATAPTVTTAFPYDVVVGDTFLIMPFKQGNSNIYIGGPGLYVDGATAPAIDGSNLFNVFVYKLDLSTAGREYLDFRFGGDHFCRFRA